MHENTTVRMQRCLDRLRAGDAAARNELVAAASERLTRLARKMLKGRLRRLEQTGDVLHNAVVRLCRALQGAPPATLREFFGLAALQVRRELIDLARHHFGPHGAAAHQQSDPLLEGSGAEEGAALDFPDRGDEPSNLAAWGEVHEKVGALAEEEREVFNLVYYQGLTHAEAAALLGVSTKTIQRRWQSACLALHDLMGGELPEL
jgi:RNA polymerase sigma-70 factor (ECF subfamily)